MNKQEKTAMAAMTKRLHQIEKVMETGCELAECSMCLEVSGDCFICLAKSCLGDEDFHDRRIMEIGYKEERKTAAKRHHKRLVKRLQSKGYDYE